MPNLRDLFDIQYRQKLAREYSHPSSGYIPTKQEIDEAIAVGTGRKPQDVAYGEQGLQAPAVAGGLVSLDPTDYLSGAGLSKLAMLSKGGLAMLPIGMMRSNSNIPQLIDDAEKAMLRYELSKIPNKPAVSLRDLAIGGGALGAGGLAGYYGIGAMTE